MFSNFCEKCVSKMIIIRTCFRRNIINTNNFVRQYHSDNVFGFKHKTKTIYTLPENVIQSRCAESNFFRLVTAYREHGHKKSDIDPVVFTKTISVLPELDPKRYCLNLNDIVKYNGIINTEKDSGTVQEGIEFLKEVYSKNIASEFLHLENEEEIEWFANKIEELPRIILDDSTKVELCEDLLKSQAFDNFLANKFAGLKRYGGEGAESMMGFFKEIFKLSARDTLEQLVLAMPHRGRLNLLTGLLNFPPIKMFHKLKGNPDFPSKYKATGDVLSHVVSSTDLKFGTDSIHVTVLYNPSHLEAVNPVSMGKTRAKQLLCGDGDYGRGARWSDKVLNVQVHGDAAIIGQGINQECLSLSNAPHFEIGGSIHLVVNNQLGFTTPADRGRSSRYCTDLAKIISAPVIHVNGYQPEAIIKATRLAYEYQRKFRNDIFIDINCYRQWGHNEMDDPTFTNPGLYRIIHSKSTVPDEYAKKLIKSGLITESRRNDIMKQHNNWLNENLKASENYQPDDSHFKKNWEGYEQASNRVTSWDTGIDLDLMTYIGSKSVKYPQDFNIHPTLLRTHVRNRLSKVSEGVGLDWSTSEAIAIGSLLYEGYNVRISGQDVGRGTFSHRHMMLVDQETNKVHIPLNELVQNQTGYLELANSILSEEAVMGYEYGMSIESPQNLIIWEAQFGDFMNGAQIILDVFVTTGETKWLLNSGLVITLPHGFDGAGPDHSSSRVERFLQCTDSKEDAVDGDDVNFEVCQPSTPAQYFHLLRRQMIRNYRKPLIIITPKTLLRLSDCVSNFSDMAPGTTFKPVIGENLHDPLKISRVLLTSGKHYYSLLERKKSMRKNDVAIVRLESFCPFPVLALEHELAKFPNAKEFVWCQEEPQNMGAWSFVKPRFQNLLGRKLYYSGRKTSPVAAVGVNQWHQQEVAEILSKPFVSEFGLNKF